MKKRRKMRMILKGMKVYSNTKAMMEVENVNQQLNPAPPIMSTGYDSPIGMIKRSTQPQRCSTSPAKVAP